MTTRPPRNDAKDDLLADLQSAVAERPLPVAPPVEPIAAAEPLLAPTPAFDLRVTPLRWSRPAVVPSPTGFGLGVRLGPVRVSLSLGG